MLKLVDVITVYFNDCKEKTFDKMIDALDYVNKYGVGKKVKFHTCKEFIKC